MRREVITTELGVMIREYRVKNHITQDRLGKRLGVNRNTVHLWETQVNRPSLSTMSVLSDLFEVSLADIMKMAEATCRVQRDFDSVRK